MLYTTPSHSTFFMCVLYEIVLLHFKPVTSRSMCHQLLVCQSCTDLKKFKRSVGVGTLLLNSNLSLNFLSSRLRQVIYIGKTVYFVFDVHTFRFVSNDKRKLRKKKRPTTIKQDTQTFSNPLLHSHGSLGF